ncbi:hypothetical protein SprV_0301351500 [Sparganum proliferum]
MTLEGSQWFRAPTKLTSDGETGSSLGTLKANSFVLDFRSNFPFFCELGNQFPLTDYLDCLTPHSPGQHSTRSRNPSLNSILWPSEVSFKMQWQD